jgi:hypothetical protein
MEIDLKEYRHFNNLNLKEILMILKEHLWTTDGIPTKVDGSDWYTVSTGPEVSRWIKTTFPEQYKVLWFYIDRPNHVLEIDRFDIHEHLYTQLILTWNHT